MLAWTEFAPIIEGLPGITVRTLPSRRVKELNDDLKQAPQAQTGLGLPAFDRVINVSHDAFASWLSSRLDVKSRDGGALTADGEWLYYGDWLTLFAALAGIPRENRFNIADLYRACAAAGPPPPEARAHATCASPLPFELPEGRLAVVAPGANEDHRRFALAHTLKLLPKVAEMGFNIVLAGAPADQPLARSIVEGTTARILDLTGKTNVQQLAEILRRADIVLTADSGPAHIAAALGRPLVGLYGACLAPLTTAPWGAGHVILVHDSMQAFSPGLVLAAIRVRLGLPAEEDLRREALHARVQAWRTAMLPDGADPLGGITYLPLHADRLDGPDTLRRLMRHVMASVIMEKNAGDMSDLARLATPPDPEAMAPAGECERQLRTLAADVGRGLAQLRRRRFDGLQELAARVTRTVDELKNGAIHHPAIAPVLTFLDWKLRVMPAYSPERIFQEYERELQRATKTLKMAREAATKLRVE